MILQRIGACRRVFDVTKIALRSSVKPEGCFCRRYGKKAEENDEPIQFSKSEAASGTMAHRVKSNRDAPWFEAPIIMVSLGAFMIYFCALREENDLDDEMRVSLFDRLPGLEESQPELAEQMRKGIPNPIKSVLN